MEGEERRAKKGLKRPSVSQPALVMTVRGAREKISSWSFLRQKKIRVKLLSHFMDGETEVCKEWLVQYRIDSSCRSKFQTSAITPKSKVLVISTRWVS